MLLLVPFQVLASVSENWWTSSDGLFILLASDVINRAAQTVFEIQLSHKAQAVIYFRNDQSSFSRFRADTWNPSCIINSSCVSHHGYCFGCRSSPYPQYTFLLNFHRLAIWVGCLKRAVENESVQSSGISRWTSQNDSVPVPLATLELVTKTPSSSPQPIVILRLSFLCRAACNLNAGSAFLQAMTEFVTYHRRLSKQPIYYINVSDRMYSNIVFISVEYLTAHKLTRISRTLFSLIIPFVLADTCP